MNNNQITQITADQIYKMDLHEIISNKGICILRVPGGWIYEMCMGGIWRPGIFIPFNNEFMVQELLEKVPQLPSKE